MDASSAVPPHSRTGAGATVLSLRKAAGLSPAALAAMLGTSTAAIRDLETNDDELFRSYSVNELRLVAAALGVEPVTLLNCPPTESPINGTQLLEMIRQQLATTREVVTAFENLAGWRLEPLLRSPEQLLSDLTVDALQGLCRALAIDWRRGETRADSPRDLRSDWTAANSRRGRGFPCGRLARLLCQGGGPSAGLRLLRLFRLS